MKNLISTFVFFFFIFLHATGQILDVDGKAKVNVMDKNNNADSIVVWLPDHTIGIRDASTIQYQMISISDDSIFLSNGGYVVLDIHRNESGDLKHSIVSADHSGWYLLDGRDVSTLPTSAKSNAIGLGFDTNLPDMSDRFLKNTNGTETVGGKGGKSSVTLTQANIPSYSFPTVNTTMEGIHTHSSLVSSDGIHLHSGTTNPAGMHSHSGSTSNSGSHSHVYEDYGRGGVDAAEDDFLTSAAQYTNVGIANNSIPNSGSHIHSFTTNSVANHNHSFTSGSAGLHTHTVTNSNDGNHAHTVTVQSGGSGNAFAIEPKYMVTNTFIYLGKE